VIFGRKKEAPLQIDLGDLKEEKARLINFLESHLKVDVFEEKNVLKVDQGKVSLTNLHYVVKKFLYHRNLSNTHYLTLEGLTVKINRFKSHRKKDKNKHSDRLVKTITETWGL